ncbi:MAG: hypothetical protein ABJG41_00965 [Cyclobacteriaceae bacterium]
MRLGQLARKYDISAQDIIAYTKSKGFEINPHPNSKLDEEIEAMVVEHFDVLPVVEEITEQLEEPEIADEGPTTEDIIEESGEQKQEDESVNDLTAGPTEDAPIENLEEQDEATVELAEQPESVEDLTDDSAESEVEPDVKIATVGEILEDESEELANAVSLIKAPKVELEGLKVVGKIDLPEPKPKEEKSTEESENESEPRKGKGKYKNRKVLTPEQREERRVKAKKKREEKEEWEEHKKKLRAERRKKAQKEKFYKEKVQAEIVQSKVATKPKKKKKNQVTQEVDNRPKPKTALGKFWRWLNT